MFLKQTASLMTGLALCLTINAAPAQTSAENQDTQTDITKTIAHDEMEITRYKQIIENERLQLQQDQRMDAGALTTDEDNIMSDTKNLQRAQMKLQADRNQGKNR